MAKGTTNFTSLLFLETPIDGQSLDKGRLYCLIMIDIQFIRSRFFINGFKPSRFFLSVPRQMWMHPFYIMTFYVLSIAQRCQTQGNSRC